MNNQILGIRNYALISYSLRQETDSLSAQKLIKECDALEIRNIPNVGFFIKKNQPKLILVNEISSLVLYYQFCLLVLISLKNKMKNTFKTAISTKSSYIEMTHSYCI